MTNIRPPLNLEQLFARTTEIFKANFSLLFILGFLGNIIFVSHEILTRIYGEELKGSIVMMCFGYIAFVWSIVAIAYAVSRILSGESIRLQQILRLSPAILLRSFVSNILYMVLLFGGLILLIIPGVYAGVVFSLCYFPIILENKGVIEGFKISRDLIKGYFWTMFLVGMGFCLSMSVLSILAAFTGPLQGVFSMLISIFYIVYVTVLELLIYNRLKEIKGANIL